MKNKIIDAYEKYKKTYEMPLEQFHPFSAFNKDPNNKYKTKYHSKNIPNGINIAKENISNLIDAINYHDTSPLLNCLKKKKHVHTDNSEISMNLEFRTFKTIFNF